MDYKEVANGNVIFMLCAIVVLFVLFQAIVFMKKAWRRGKELNMDKDILKRVIKSSIIFSIIPSLPILIVFLVLIPNLGQFFPWLRLSVVGSGVYENMAADVTAKAFGLNGIGDGLDLQIFTSALFVMTIGIIWGPIYISIGAKYIQKGVRLLKGKNASKFNAIFATMFIAMLSVFSGPYLASVFKIQNSLTTMVPFLVFIVASVCIYIIDIIASKTKSKTISEFSFSISLVVGMASSILFNYILS